MYYEPDQGTDDDTGINGMEVRCRGPGMFGTLTETVEEKSGFEESKWSHWSSTCPPGTAVCALMTKVEDDQGSEWGLLFSDDAALTDGTLYCCDYRANTWTNSGWSETLKCLAKLGIFLSGISSLSVLYIWKKYFSFRLWRHSTSTDSISEVSTRDSPTLHS